MREAPILAREEDDVSMHGSCPAASLARRVLMSRSQIGLGLGSHFLSPFSFLTLSLAWEIMKMTSMKCQSSGRCFHLLVVLGTC